MIIFLSHTYILHPGESYYIYFNEIAAGIIEIATIG